MNLILPTFEVVRDLHDVVLGLSGGMPGIRIEADIHRAVERPVTHTVYVESYDIDTICALLIDSIARYHGFVDGNKRTALMTAVFTYRVNGVHFRATATMNKEFDALVMWVVKKKPEIRQIQERLQHLRGKYEVSTIPSFNTMFAAFMAMRKKKEQARKNKR